MGPLDVSAYTAIAGADHSNHDFARLEAPIAHPSSRGSPKVRGRVGREIAKTLAAELSSAHRQQFSNRLRLAGYG